MACGGCKEKQGKQKAVNKETTSAIAVLPTPTSPVLVRASKKLVRMRLELCKQCSEMVLDEKGGPTEQYLVGVWDKQLHCGNPNNPDTNKDPERYGCGCAVNERAIWQGAACPRKKWGPGNRFVSTIIPMFMAPRDEILPGVIDYVGPTRTLEGVNDCCGIGDVMVQGVVVQAIKRFNADRGIKVRYLTADGRLPWAALSAPGVEIISISDATRTPGEFVQHSAPLRALEVDATCRMQGQNRHQFLASQFGVPEDYVKEWDVSVADDAMEEADEFLTIPKKDNRPIICVSPHANSPTRQWPLRHWCHLIERLKKRDFAVFILHRPIPPGVADPIKSIPARRFGSNDPQRVAAIVAQSDIVLGCDSGMCHLAGILHKPALAICGPTEGSIVFGGWPTVEHLQAPGPCTGCLWFRADGWKPWCGFGCEALADFKPQVMEARTVGILKEIGRL